MNDTPKMFGKHPMSESHAILVNDPYDPGHTIIIPLHIVGVASAFTARTPSQEEFTNEDIPQIVMTGGSPDWKPYMRDWSNQ